MHPKNRSFICPDKISTLEFIILMAVLTGLAALATDIILPALANISSYHPQINPNHFQLMVSLFFLGMALGSIFFGPLSDHWGRKKAMISGLIVFLLGCFITLSSDNFLLMLGSRFVQGFGAASARIICNAIIRDCYAGRQMAKIMSLVATIFIMLPVVAPFIGQQIILLFNWNFIFIFLILFCLFALFWFALRQKETLKTENIIIFNFKNIKEGVIESFKYKDTFCYTLGMGFALGNLLIFLSISPQVFDYYQVGDDFPLYFAFVAVSMGIASIINSYFVVQYGMSKIAHLFLNLLIIISAIFYLYLQISSQNGNLWLFVVFMMMVFFCLGMIFANFMTLAMQPVGHIAGIASSVLISTSLLMSFIIASIIGQFYQNSTDILVIGFFITSMLTKILINLTYKTNIFKNLKA